MSKGLFRIEIIEILTVKPLELDSRDESRSRSIIFWLSRCPFWTCWEFLDCLHVLFEPFENLLTVNMSILNLLRIPWLLICRFWNCWEFLDCRDVHFITCWEFLDCQDVLFETVENFLTVKMSLLNLLIIS
jgi:hypothetical protein